MMISQQQAGTFAASVRSDHLTSPGSLLVRVSCIQRHKVLHCCQSKATCGRVQPAESITCRAADGRQHLQHSHWLRREQQVCHKPGPSSSSSRAAIIAAAAIAEGSDRLLSVLSAIDAINSQDPRSIEWQGQQVPYELAYSQWLSEWVAKLAPADPSEELLIVARGQHVGRWKSPRSDYPEGRQGYLKWREDLKRTHASTVTGAMQQAGYPDASCEKVRCLIMKRDLKTDPEAQAVEDALCLVFLQHQFAELLAKEGADKMVGIVAKTWAKMGERGRAAALELAPALPEDQLSVVKEALAAKD